MFCILNNQQQVQMLLLLAQYFSDGLLNKYIKIQHFDIQFQQDLNKSQKFCYTIQHLKIIISNDSNTSLYSLFELISIHNINITSKMQEGKKQIEGSFKAMDKVFHQRNEPIVDLRVKNQQLQKNSRIFDERRAQQRLIAIQQEAVTSNKKNTALEIKWSELKQYQQCESLSKSINEQKQAFHLIIAAKDKLINQFWEQLKKRDDQYSKTLKEQANDIKTLVSKMREQYFFLRDQSIRELDQIQRKFEAERKGYIEKAKGEVDQCFKKHINMEQSFAESRRRQEEEFQRAIEKLRVQGMQNYTSTKIKMQNDIQNLQKCYEEMKALYQLNTEKLDYNLKILKEKREQNHENHEQLKKKESFLNTRYRNLRSQYQKQDKEFKDLNKQLTTDYKRITRQFKELQRKFKHFQKSDLQRYNQIQAMNQIEVQELKDKIIKCDMVVHNQQLGLDWIAFNTNQEEKTEEKPVVVENQDDQDQQTQLVVGEQKLSQILDILIEEGDFIFDDKMREELERASHEQKLKEKLQILKKTLNIDSIEELNIFIDDIANQCKYVSEKQKHTLHQEKLRKQQEAREEEERALKKKKKGEEKKVEKVEAPIQQEDPKVDLSSDFKVDPVLVVDFLVEWMSGMGDRKKMLQKNTKKSLKQLSEREKKDLIAREGKKYWEKMTQVLPDRTFRIWKVLDKSFGKYHDLLQSRQNLINETGELHNQNEELKNLLNQYIRINHELIIPPTKMMEKQE